MYLSVLNDCLFPARWEGLGGWVMVMLVIASSCLSWTFPFLLAFCSLLLTRLPKHLPSLKFLRCLVCNRDEAQEKCSIHLDEQELCVHFFFFKKQFFRYGFLFSFAKCSIDLERGGHVYHRVRAACRMFRRLSLFYRKNDKHIRVL